MTSFWLSNTCRLLHCLKQYSGDEVSAKISPAPKGLLKAIKLPQSLRQILISLDTAMCVQGRSPLRDRGCRGRQPCSVQMWFYPEERL